MLDAVEAAARTIMEASRALLPLLLVGAPMRHQGRVYNTALAIHRGRLLGVVPKTYLPNYREFYEPRQFASGDGWAGGSARFAGETVPFGPDLLFAAEDLPDFTVHAEICEDFWIPVPPSSLAALAGATVLANLSGSPITIGKADTRRLLCQSQSVRCLAAYLYAAAGAGESTTDVAWDGQATIFENGLMLAETERFPDGERIALADIDLDLLRQERMRMGSSTTTAAPMPPPPAPSAASASPAIRRAATSACCGRWNGSLSCRPTRRGWNRIVTKPTTSRSRASRSGCAAAGIRRAVIGVSGGLDSTQALLVTARAFDRLGRARSDILAYTMPGFATGTATKANAIALMQALGVTWRELDIRPAARLMLEDLGHQFAAGEPVYDVTFENVQAGLRTDYLFRLANQHDGIVIGTGDLSELALGWCTYGVGDQMSHYNVNAGVPKTLIQHLIRWVIASGQFAPEVGVTLEAILGTEISPELIPVAEGETPQSTEAMVGPYALQDFTLYYTLRFGFRPSKIAFLALHAWEDAARGTGRRASRPIVAQPTILQRSAAGCASSCTGSSPPASSSARRCRTVRRSPPADRCRRAGTGGHRRTATHARGWRSWSGTYPKSNGILSRTRSSGAGRRPRRSACATPRRRSCRCRSPLRRTNPGRR